MCFIRCEVETKYVISDEWAREEGRNNYFVGTGINAAWAPGRCIMASSNRTSIVSGCLAPVLFIIFIIIIIIIIIILF